MVGVAGAVAHLALVPAPALAVRVRVLVVVDNQDEYWKYPLPTTAGEAVFLA